MKQFFKNVASTIVGLFIFSALTMVLGIICLVGMVADSDTETTLQDNSVMVLKLDGTINDFDDKNVFASLFHPNEEVTGLNNILSAIKKAKNEDQIKGIYLESGTVSADYATLQEIRKALYDFRKSGKWIIAYGDMMSQGGYYLSSVANKVFINPSGSVDWHGIASTPMFLKDLYAKFGVKYTVVKVGKYKSATEMFTEDKMSESNRLQVSRYINGLWQQVVADVAQSRNIPAKTLNAYADGMMVFEDSKALVARKMVDGLCYYDQIKEEVRKQLGLKTGDRINQAGLNEVINLPNRNNHGGEIAVLHCEGDIVQTTTMASSGNQMIVAPNVVKELDRLANDEKTKAVVIRINSGGGDAYASEQIWRAVSALNRKKPVVVSMGGMAASGAYYMSMGAQYIFAQPTTLTGSIGIFGAFPDLSGLLTQKLGVKFDEVKTNRNSGYTAALMARPFNEEEMSYLQAYINRGYELFRQRVADGRKLPTDKVEEIAQGRVWLGADAKSIKLVDELGGLDEAVAKAAKLANMKDYHVTELPKNTDMFEQLMASVSGNKDNYLDEKLHATLGELYTPLMWLRKANERQAIQAALPFALNIK